MLYTQPPAEIFHKTQASQQMAVVVSKFTLFFLWTIILTFSSITDQVPLGLFRSFGFAALEKIVNVALQSTQQIFLDLQHEQLNCFSDAKPRLITFIFVLSFNAFPATEYSFPNEFGNNEKKKKI